MPGPEARESPEFSKEERGEREFLRRTFGLVQVNPIKDRGVPQLAYISEFDGWAVERESFLGKWLEFAPVKRLRGICQLGLNRDLPLPNPHTRFEHSAELAIRSTLQLRRLSSPHFREEFLRMSSHYPLNFNPHPFVSQETRKDIQILQTIKLGAIYSALHDIATPAGGDTVKYIFGLDDDRDFPQVLNWNFAEFAQLCQEDGFDPEEAIRLFTGLAKRKDKGVLGQAIHCPGGENRSFDLDSLCYTLMDAQVALGLSWDQPEENKKTPEIIREELEATAKDLKKQQKEINQQVRDLVKPHERTLREAFLRGLPPNLEIFVFPKVRKPALALSDFDPFSSLALQEGRAVFTDPRRLANLWLLQDFLATNLYFSPQTLGPEVGLAATLLSERENRPFSEKEKRYLLTVDDWRLWENLQRNFPSSAYWFSNLAAWGWEGENLGRGASPSVFFLGGTVVSPDEIGSYLAALLKIRKIPTRFATPVSVLGEVRNLRKVLPDEVRELRKRKRRQGELRDLFPRWTRPTHWVWADEFARPERHNLERQPYW